MKATRFNDVMRLATDFLDTKVRPHVDGYDAAGELPGAILDELKQHNLLNAGLDGEQGGWGLEPRELWQFFETVGACCSSLRSILTVHDMVMKTLWRFMQRGGTDGARGGLFAGIVSRREIAAFALTEDGAGSDSSLIETEARAVPEGYVLNGCKRWITAARIANWFLVFAKVDGKPTAFVVDARSAGLRVLKKENVLATQASMIGDVVFEDCFVPHALRLGRVGAGLDWVAAYALDHGRFSVAAGGVGLAHACLHEGVEFCRTRVQGGAKLMDHAVLVEKVAQMTLAANSARLMGLEAASRRGAASFDAAHWTIMAKQHSADAARHCADALMQLMGSRGFDTSGKASRYFRDSRLYQIIEGTNEINMDRIGRTALLMR